MDNGETSNAGEEDMEIDFGKKYIIYNKCSKSDQRYYKTTMT